MFLTSTVAVLTDRQDLTWKRSCQVRYFLLPVVTLAWYLLSSVQMKWIRCNICQINCRAIYLTYSFWKKIYNNVLKLRHVTHPDQTCGFFTFHSGPSLQLHQCLEYLNTNKVGSIFLISFIIQYNIKITWKSFKMFGLCSITLSQTHLIILYQTVSH